MHAPHPHPLPYREREEYQLARALLGDVVASTSSHPRNEPLSSEAAQLRRSAVALPNVFLPTSPTLNPDQQRDSQRLVLQDLADALGVALDSGLLDIETAQRIDLRKQAILERINNLA